MTAKLSRRPAALLYADAPPVGETVTGDTRMGRAPSCAAGVVRPGYPNRGALTSKRRPRERGILALNSNARWRRGNDSNDQDTSARSGRTKGRRRGNRLIIRQKEPRNLETPFDQVRSFLTPTELFYIRSHFPAPTVDLASYRLRAVSSCGPQPKLHPPPPMAQAPKPTGVMSSPLDPSGRVGNLLLIDVISF